MFSFPLQREIAGLKGLLSRGAYGAGVFTAPSWMPALFNQGQSSSALSQNVGRIPGMTANPQTDVGRRLGSWLGNQAQYIGGQLASGHIPYTKPNAQQTGMYGRYVPGSQQQSFEGSAGSQGSQGSPAAERAYQAEKSRVAQLTAQDPELQRYESARLKAVAPGATPETIQSAEDIGMQMWAKANPTLAAKVKPGQAGYDAIQNQLNAGQMGAPMELGAFAGSQPTGLLFNPSSPLGAPPQTGGTDYTQVVPATIPGAQGVMGSYFNNQQQAKMFSRFQQAAPAQTGMNPGLAPGSPYAQAAAAAGGASYAGAAGLQPMGASLAQDANAFASEKARLQAEEFKKRALSMQQ